MANLSFILKSAGWLGCLLIFLAVPLRALDEPTSFVIDLPFQANAATPLWLGHPATPQRNFAALDLPISPPDANASLLVTVFFQEKEGGFLRVTWQGSQTAQVLSDNFYEGIGMSNQRSLLIPAETLQGDGTLNFQCSDTTLGIQRVKLEWVENKNSLVSPQIQDVLVAPAVGAIQLSQNLNGQPAQESDAAWHREVVTVPIATVAQRIEQGVEFSVQLDQAPGAVRLSLKEAGLAWGSHLVVWVNQQRAGVISPMVPDLLDDGFFTDTSSTSTYVGWRNGSFYIPATFLKIGANTLQFSVEDEVTATTQATPDPAASASPPLAVKEVVLQLNYLATPPVVTPPSTQPADSVPLMTPTPTLEPSPAPIFSTPETNTP